MDFAKIILWIKTNILMTIGIGLVLIILFFPKLLRGLFGRKRVRRRRPLPRSVGMRRHVSHRSTGAKRPWQIKGSAAAKARMAKIRRRR